LTQEAVADTLKNGAAQRCFVRAGARVAPSFNGRTVGSEPINRGSNPWGATRFYSLNGVTRAFWGLAVGVSMQRSETRTGFAHWPAAALVKAR
jgi:hypothetical protein